MELRKVVVAWYIKQIQIREHHIDRTVVCSQTLEDLHGTHVKVPNNKDIMDLVLKFPAS